MDAAENQDLVKSASPASEAAVETSQPPEPLRVESIETPRQRMGYHGWTFLLISVGIGLIACCLLVPEIDTNRRLVYECEKLQVDLDQLERQVHLNSEFLAQMDDPDKALAERLAQRQMKVIRKGTRVLDLQGKTGSDTSPLALVNLAPPPPMPEMHIARGGRLIEACRDPKSRLYLLAAGMMLLAMGLVLGSTDTPKIVSG